MANSTHKAESAQSNPLTFTLSPGMAPAAPLMRTLARFDRKKVEAFAEVSIALLDLIDGDEDLEPNGDDEPVHAEGDSQDAAWIEWNTMRGSQKRGPNIATEYEDDEEEDPREDDDPDHEHDGCEHEDYV